MSNESGQIMISLPSVGLKIAIHKNKELDPEDYGALIDVIQYKDKYQFETVANYVFEGVSIDENTGPSATDRSHFFDAIVFFFGSVVGSPNYRITIPEFSSFYDEPVPAGTYGKFMKESDLGSDLSPETLTPETLKLLGYTGEIDDDKLPF